MEGQAATTTQTAVSDPSKLATEDLGQGVIVHYAPKFLSSEEATALFENVMASVKWEHSQRSLPDGSKVHLPRLQAWMSTEGKRVTSLYQKNPATVWTEPVLKVKSAIEAALGNRCTFDYVLINLYRDGEDMIGFHVDDEAEGVNETCGPKNIIASLSVGETRTFVLRHSKKKRLVKNYALESGSLLVMDGTTQKYWRHGVPKEPHVKGPRVNLTFRVS